MYPQNNGGRGSVILTAVSTIRIFSPSPLSLFYAEWTQISTRYLREQLVKISDFYHMASSTGDGPVPVPPEVEQAMKQWEYNEKLAFHMFQVTWPRCARKGHHPRTVHVMLNDRYMLRDGLLGGFIILQTSQNTLTINVNDIACYIPLRLMAQLYTCYMWSAVD